MEGLNLRIYKAIFSNDYQIFEVKTGDHRGCVWYASLESVAESIRARSRLDGLRILNIDFKPFHDIEIPSDLSPRKRVPLSAEEQNLLWELLKK